MHGRTGALLACTVLVLAAGCVGVGDEDDTRGNASTVGTSNATDRAGQDGASATATSDPAESSLFPGSRPAANGTNATDLRVIEVTLEDPARLQGSTWTVPEEAVVEETFWPFEDPPETVILRGVSVLEGSASSLEAWGLFAYRMGHDTAELLSATVASPVTVETWDPAPPETEAYEVQPNPFVMYLGQDDLEPGDTVGFVLAARGQAGAPFGVALQPLVDPPEDEFPEPPEGLDELRDAAPGTALLPLEGEGTGLHVGTYLDATFTRFAQRIEVRSPGVQVDERLPEDRPPGASVRATTVASSFAADGGWATASAGAFGDVDAGRWEGSVHAHGVEVEGGGPHVHSPAGLGPLVTGFPYLWATGGGEGGSEAAFTLQTANVDELVFFDHLALGEPLEALVGQPAAEDRGTFEGLADDPPAWRPADDQWTRVGGPGPSLTLTGVPLPSGGPAVSG